MKALNEKSDLVLHLLHGFQKTSWDKFSRLTGIQKGDGVLSFLKNYKAFIDYNDSEIGITEKGKEFIETTSFTEQRGNITLL